MKEFVTCDFCESSCCLSPTGEGLCCRCFYGTAEQGKMCENCAEAAYEHAMVRLIENG